MIRNACIWVILVVKLKQYHYQELLQLTILVAIVDDAVTTKTDGTISSRWYRSERRNDKALTVRFLADTADAVTTAKILDGTILAAILQLTPCTVKIRRC
jgi:hypothetical protein